MPNKVLPKRSYTAAMAPTAADLEVNELAINWADGIAYTKNAAGEIVSVAMGGGGGSGEADIRWNLFLPPPPTAVSGSGADGEVAVSWTAPTVLDQTPITDYVVQYSSDSGTTWSTFANGTSTATTATVTGLTNGTAYAFRVAAVSGVGQGAWSDASAAVTPSGLAVPQTISGLQLWLDASDASTLYDATSGGSLVAADGTVKRWEDKSGNDRHATESTNGPARKAAEQNGLDALLFDGVDDALTISYNITGLNAITVFAVAKNAGTLSDNPDVIGNYGNTGQTDGFRMLLGYNDAAVAVGGRPTSSGDAFATADSGSESLDFIVATGIVSNGSVSARTNGTSLATYSASAGNLVGESVLEIAHLSSFSTFRNVYVAEIIIYNSALSDTDREAVENYLMTKWGIS